MARHPQILPPGPGLPVHYPSGYNGIDLCPTDDVREFGPYENFPWSPFYRPVKGFRSVYQRPGHYEITACLPPKIEDNCRFWWILRMTCFERFGTLLAPNDIDWESEVDMHVYRSLLKADVMLVDSNRGTTRFVVDLGSGTQISVGPVQRVRLQILAPDVDAYLEDGGDPAPRTPTSMLRGTVHASSVMSDPMAGTGTFTQPLFLSDVKPSWTLRIPNFADALAVTPLPPGGAPSSWIVVEYLREHAPGVFQPLGTRYVDSWTAGMEPLPRLATHVRVSLDSPPASYQAITDLVFRIMV